MSRSTVNVDKLTRGVWFPWIKSFWRYQVDMALLASLLAPARLFEVKRRIFIMLSDREGNNGTIANVMNK